MKDRVKRALILLAAGTAVNIALAIIKMYVGLSSNSLTIMLDSMNSFFDIITCAITILAFCLLLRKKNENFPHGYGRSEYLASFIVAVVSAVVGGLFFFRSLNRMAMPEPVWFGVQSCVLVGIGIPLKLAIGLGYHFANRKLRSKAIAAIELDSYLDVGITTTSLISYAVSGVVDYAVDAIFGIVLSVVIVIFAIKMIYSSVRSVVLGDVDLAAQEKIRAAALNQPCVKEVKEVSLHDYGYGEKVATIVAVMEEGATLTDVNEARERVSQIAAEAAGKDFPPRIDLVPVLDEKPDIQTSEGSNDSETATDNPDCSGTTSDDFDDAEDKGAKSE